MTVHSATLEQTLTSTESSLALKIQWLPMGVGNIAVGLDHCLEN